MPIVTVSDPPGADSSVRNRYCPNLVAWWSFSWDAYSLAGVDDRIAYARRVCMWTVLVLRTLLGFLGFWRYAQNLDIAMMVMGPILSVVEFFWIAFCLAHIGQSEGKRRVLGIMVGRWHFDVFLVLCAVSHILTFAAHFLWPNSLIRGSASTLWWILITATAWVASWPAEESGVDDEDRVNLV